MADRKRNEISSAAGAYATAFLSDSALYSDSMTVSPYLGRDRPGTVFVKACAQGGSAQDFEPWLARFSGPKNSKLPAVRCANPSRRNVSRRGPQTSRPDAARHHSGAGLRRAGRQCSKRSRLFPQNGSGAVVSSSRGITYAHREPGISRVAFALELHPHFVSVRAGEDDVELHLRSAVGDEEMIVDHVDQIVACAQHVRPGADVLFQPIGGTQLEEQKRLQPTMGVGGSATWMRIWTFSPALNTAGV